MRKLVTLALVAVAATGCGGSRDVQPPNSWKRVATPAVPGTALLAGVSCVSTSFCVAVGRQLQRLVSHTLAERWDGTRWHVVPTNAPADRRSGFTAVSCVTPSFCVAAGTHFADDGSHALLEVWNGRSWRVTPTGANAGTEALSGVSCASVSFCVAVGTTRGGNPHALVERWDGDRWQPAQNPGGASSTSLAAVSCVEGPFCVAVGQRSSDTRVATFAQSLDGAGWRVEASPDVTVYSSLAGAACVARDWCLGVGSHYRGQGTGTLVLRRESTWSLRPSPSRSFMSGFTAVSCVSHTACVAVGSQRAGAANRGLIAAWNGSEWVIAGGPDPAGTDVLAAVSCVNDQGQTRCFAVGSSGPAIGLGSKPFVVSASA